jgi:hypothetical protein
MIQPLETESFMAQQKTTYEEVGLVLDAPEYISDLIGTHVYFDSWLAKKFPVKGTTDKFVWFVNSDDLVAYEPVSE